MMNDYQETLSGRLLDQLEYPRALLTEEEVSYYRGCGFDNTCSVPPCNLAAGTAKRRGRPGNNIRRFFYAIDTVPRAVQKLCRQYGVSLNTVRQALRFDRYPDKGRVKTRTIDGVLMIWRETNRSESQLGSNS